MRSLPLLAALALAGACTSDYELVVHEEHPAHPDAPAARPPAPPDPFELEPPFVPLPPEGEMQHDGMQHGGMQHGEMQHGPSHGGDDHDGEPER